MIAEYYQKLPQKGGEVFSAATLRPSDSVTIDDQGFGSRPDRHGHGDLPPLSRAIS